MPSAFADGIHLHTLTTVSLRAEIGHMTHTHFVNFVLEYIDMNICCEEWKYFWSEDPERACPRMGEALGTQVTLGFGIRS
ncbi:hypothetical protein KSD_87190 [Ktedonobacter sp. SOSP1-85]|nr:hypothetical protein KSD_87190 [Ktedonobacter sp. SOSP1-85]